MGKTTRRGSLALTAALAVVLSTAGIASADADFKFERVAGQSRYGTSADIAAVYGDTENVILASGKDAHTADALAAAYLAGQKGASILLTEQAETPKVILAQLEERGVKNITIVGGELAVSAEQEKALKDAGYTVDRLAGQTREDTAAAIIAAVEKAPSTTALVANAYGFADALAAGPLAYVAGMPLAVTGVDAVDEDVVKALTDAGVTKAIVLGGEKAVSQAVIDQLDKAGIKLETRLAGTSRSGTSAAIANHAVNNGILKNTGVNLASGRAFGNGADALSGGPLTGKQERPLIISESAETLDRLGESNLADFLKKHSATLTEGQVFGGELAVSVNVVTAAEKAAQGEAPGSNQSITVTPAEAASLTFNATASETSAEDERQYSASGLDDSKSYRVALVNAANVKVDATGNVAFADAGTPGDNVADGVGSSASASISVANGTTVNADITGSIKPVNGVINFTVDGDAAGAVVPVVWIDANGDNALNLVAPIPGNGEPKAPAEAFGVGGTVTFGPAESTGGDFGTSASQVAVASVDKATDSFATAAATFKYDSNDKFTVDGVPATFETFESKLSPSDTVFGTYAPNRDLSSTFNLTQVNPGAPTAVNGVQSGAAVAVSWAAPAGASGVQDTYNVYRATAPAAATDATGAPAAPGAGWTKVGSVEAMKTSFTDKTVSVPADNSTNKYYYYVSAVNSGDEGNPSARALASVTKAGAADATAPLIASAALTKDAGFAGTADAGDVWTLAVTDPNSSLAAPKAGDTIRLNDGDTAPTVVDVVNGTNATFTLNTADVTIGGTVYSAGHVLTVTLVGSPVVVTAGTDAGLQYDATIANTSGITDTASNRIDLGASTDKLID